MTIQCKKCKCENVEFENYEVSSEEVNLENVYCHNCGHSFDMLLTNRDEENSKKSGCLKCSSEDVDSHEWGSELDEDGYVVMTVFYNCNQCDSDFERTYEEE
ncbi:hypothetical protein CRN53_09165 [Vibrio vulnificus]|uniref:hypothetical protein n=1 Tax=Vibrio vulnificus TaxID=672 RepID=UPI000CD093D1|nr:hypothetical protein [Vibrio vulnificus]POB94923.1 hypothetical protein CRN53_09165 [Vibrio vulnificus]